MNFRFPSDSPASIARRALALKRECTVAAKTTRGSVFEAYLREIGHPAARFESVSIPCSDDWLKTLEKFEVEFIALDPGQGVIPAQPDALKPGDLVVMTTHPNSLGFLRTVAEVNGHSLTFHAEDSQGKRLGFTRKYSGHWRLPTPAEQAEYARTSGGWIEWKGGECPDLGATLIEVKRRDDKTFDDGNIKPANEWRHHFKKTCEQKFLKAHDIVFYRVVQK